MENFIFVKNSSILFQTMTDNRFIEFFSKYTHFMDVQTSDKDLERLAEFADEDFNQDLTNSTESTIYHSPSLLKRILLNKDFTLLVFILTKTNYELIWTDKDNIQCLIQFISTIRMIHMLSEFNLLQSKEAIVTNIINLFIQKKCSIYIGVHLLSLRILFETISYIETIDSLSDYLFNIFVANLEETSDLSILKDLILIYGIPADIRLALFTKCIEHVEKIGIDSKLHPKLRSIQQYFHEIFCKIQYSKHHTQIEYVDAMFKMCDMVYKHVADDASLVYLARFSGKSNLNPTIYFKIFEIIVKHHKGYIHPKFLKIAEAGYVNGEMFDPFSGNTHTFPEYKNDLARCVKMCSYKLLVFVVCVSDGCLKISDNADKKLAAFFNQSKNLPLEIQHKICCIVYGIQIPYSAILFDEMCRF